MFEFRCYVRRGKRWVRVANEVAADHRAAARRVRDAHCAGAVRVAPHDREAAAAVGGFGGRVVRFKRALA